MLRWCGAALLLLGTAGIGFGHAYSMKRQYQELWYLRKILLMLKGEISYTLSCISEVFFKISERIKAPYSQIFRDFAIELEKGDGRKFQQIWKESVINPLKNCIGCEKELDKLEELGENLGYLDKEMQMNYLNLYLEQMELSINDMREKVVAEGKLSKLLGLLSGFFLVIILW